MTPAKFRGLMAIAVPIGATIALLVFAAVYSPYRANAAESELGTVRDILIKGPGRGAPVYYLANNDKRYVFPNQKTYRTWFSDFSNIYELSPEEMAAFPLGGNVTYRPGIRMVKITSDPKVYAVGKRGCLHWVATEAVASSLYGSDWNTKIDDVPDAFFFSYRICQELTTNLGYQPSAVASETTSINDLLSLSVGYGARISDTSPEIGEAAGLRDCTPKVDMQEVGLSIDWDDQGLPPESFVLFGAQQDALLGRFRLVSAAEALSLKSVGLEVAPGGVVSSVSLYDGDRLVAGPAMLDSNGRAQFRQLDFGLPKDNDRQLTVRGWLKPYGQELVRTGQRVRVTMTNDGFLAEAGQFCSRTSISGGGVLGRRLPLTAADRVIRQTKPSFSAEPAGDSRLTETVPTVARFLVRADAAGKLALKRLTFTVDAETAERYSLSLPEETLVFDGVGLAGDYRLSGTCGDSKALNCTVTADLAEWLLVPAGQAKGLDLRLAIEGPRSAGDRLGVRLQGDLTPVVEGLSPEMSAYNFVWSDAPYDRHGETAVYGWSNGAHVAGLPAEFPDLGL